MHATRARAQTQGDKAWSGMEFRKWFEYVEFMQMSTRWSERASFVNLRADVNVSKFSSVYTFSQLRAGETKYNLRNNVVHHSDNPVYDANLIPHQSGAETSRKTLTTPMPRLNRPSKPVYPKALRSAI